MTHKLLWDKGDRNVKNWNIRKKMVPIYLTMTVFTFLLFFVALFMMKAIIGMEAAAANKLIGTFVWAFPVYVVIYLSITYFFGRSVAVQVAFPAKELVKAAGKIAEGDINVTLTHQATDELGTLTESFRKMVESIHEQARVLEIIAGGDYTYQLSARGENDVMNRAIISLMDKNNQLVSEIRNAASEVSSGAHQIAQGAQSLATGSTQQAASIQEFSATMEGVGLQSDNNAAAAKKTLEVTTKAGEKMGEGLDAMGQVAVAMGKIDESSDQITRVIKVIEDIAFQTNILALNAAVEAARAGEHGKGFAVVADEVRNLASKSADAAKETTVLIEDSRQRVSEGTSVVEKASAALNEVSLLAQETMGLVDSIAKDSAEQSNSIGELNAGIDQIAMVVQANSATAEQSAASAQEMSAQAEMLNRIVAQFQLRDSYGHGRNVARLPQ